MVVLEGQEVVEVVLLLIIYLKIVMFLVLRVVHLQVVILIQEAEVVPEGLVVMVVVIMRVMEEQEKIYP